MLVVVEGRCKLTEYRCCASEWFCMGALRGFGCCMVVDVGCCVVVRVLVSVAWCV